MNSEWQPIETAPKDGTEILASDGIDVFMCKWDENAYKDPSWISTYGDCYTVWDQMENTFDEHPTHWTPKPEPPK